MFNLPVITNILGVLIGINGLLMFLGIPFSIYFDDGSAFDLLIAGGITSSIGGALWFFNRNCKKDIKKREGYVIVSFGWFALALTGTLPFLISGAIPSISDAFFETMSGFTTTGASILSDIEALPEGILFWRSMTHWIGGMGIIVLSLAILPILGIGGMQLFVAEVPGLAPDKLHPRIKETAKRLWLIYVLLTIVETILLMFGGMSLFDALCHSFATMATGGFSTKNASAMEFSPYIQYVITLFMFLAGVNFSLHFFSLTGKFDKLIKNEEFRLYGIGTVVLSIIVTLGIYYNTNEAFEQSFREAIFMVVSIITTTGFVSADYTSWTPFLTMLFFMMMFLGGSAGSTGGGMKVIRILLLFKNSFLELKRLIHPRAIIPVRLNGKAVSTDIISNVLAFFLFYIFMFVFGSIFMTFLGLDFLSAIGSVAASLGNIGPGIGSVGPVDNFAHIPTIGKWFLSFLMLLGRLELFTVLILFSPYFWKK